MAKRVLILIALSVSLWGQSKGRSVMGTVTGFRPSSLEIVLKMPNGDEAPVKLSPDTVVQRVAPGSKDLKSATPSTIGEINPGDKVLVSFIGDEAVARRVVVMPAVEIEKRNEADRLDWQRRGLAGVVVSKKADEIDLRTRSMQGEKMLKVTVTSATRFKRYAPDSVKFSDAKASALAEVQSGDQLRARGKKSDDGSAVEAEEVVFGSFVTRAGEVQSVDLESRRIVVKEIGTGKPLTIQVTADSQLKAMPSFAGMGGAPGAGPGSATMAGRGAGPGEGGGMRPGGAGPMGPRPGGAPDMAQMIERMPAATLDAIKPGETVVVSSTRSAKAGEATAIMLLANAERLVRMATAQQLRGSGSARDSQNSGLSMGMGGMSGGLGGLELPGMLP